MRRTQRVLDLAEGRAELAAELSAHDSRFFGIGIPTLCPSLPDPQACFQLGSFDKRAHWQLLELGSVVVAGRLLLRFLLRRVLLLHQILNETASAIVKVSTTEPRCSTSVYCSESERESESMGRLRLGASARACTGLQ